MAIPWAKQASFFVSFFFRELTECLCLLRWWVFHTGVHSSAGVSPPDLFFLLSTVVCCHQRESEIKHGLADSWERAAVVDGLYSSQFPVARKTYHLLPSHVLNGIETLAITSKLQYRELDNTVSSLVFSDQDLCGDGLKLSIGPLKLVLATSGNQAGCSMRLLRKQLCCTLPLIFLSVAPTHHSPGLHFYFICGYSLLSCYFGLSFLGGFAMFASVAKARRGTFSSGFSVVVLGFHQLRGCTCAITPLEQPTGPCTILWDDLWLAEVSVTVFIF